MREGMHKGDRMRCAVVFAFALLVGCADGRGTVADSDLLFDAEGVRASEAALAAINWTNGGNTIKPPESAIRALREFLLEGRYTGWPRDHAPRTADRRLTGPAFGGDSYSTHARVRIFYSEGVYSWLKRRERDPHDPNIRIPEGSMIVKEMYQSEAPGGGVADPISGWAVMVRDTDSSEDGWLWYLYYKPRNETNGHEFELAQYGMSFCLACHASTTAEAHGTFSTLANIIGDDVVSYIDVPNPCESGCPPEKPPAAGHMPPRCDVSEVTLMQCLAYFAINDPLAEQAPDVTARYRLPANLPKPQFLPPDIIYDHVVAGPHNESALVTADACEGCHDATDLLKASLTEMTIPAPPNKNGLQTLNLSPTGEWAGSLMARSGRDPVFRAQAEYEVHRTPERADETLRICMGCHAPLGQRQIDLDRGSQAALTLEMLNAIPDDPATASDATYGSLGRDGVSCSICHRITPERLGTLESFTGHFVLGPPGDIYGPYEDVNEVLMKQALGFTPQQGDALGDSAMCGSCHTVYLPVYGSEPAKHIFEQTTYLEWQTSDYGTVNEAGFRPCIDCHMPNTDPLTQKPLAYKIANIEDGGFPYVPNRLSGEALEIPVRDQYRRHTLVGINRSVQAMFEQFPLLLGASTFTPNRSPTVTPSQVLTRQVTEQMAAKETVEIEITAKFEAESLAALITVKNLTGHKFPTGVGFRRAFLEIAVFDASGQRLWCSGCTDSLGLILGADGEPLPSEFDQRNVYQRDHARVTRADDVQIYESRHTDCEQQLTTSFMHLCHKVKDNRILPRGWSSGREWSEVTAPVGVEGEFQIGLDTVELRVPIADVPGAASVQVHFYYQALPPYYLRDRFELVDDESAQNTRRLAYIVAHLDRSAAGIEDWKLPLVSACVRVDGSPCESG